MLGTHTLVQAMEVKRDLLQTDVKGFTHYEKQSNAECWKSTGFPIFVLLARTSLLWGRSISLV